MFSLLENPARLKKVVASRTRFCSLEGRPPPSGWGSRPPEVARAKPVVERVVAPVVQSRGVRSRGFPRLPCLPEKLGILLEEGLYISRLYGGFKVFRASHCLSQRSQVGREAISQREFRLKLPDFEEFE